MRHEGAARVAPRVLLPSTGSLHRFGVSSSLGVMPRRNTPAIRIVSEPRIDRGFARGVGLLRVTFRLADRALDRFFADFPAADLLRAALEANADLIVLGRREGGAACLSQLREMLRDAPCHVLIVHPSGHAAVA